MLPSLEKLRKFFRLEHENGYNNTAIIGGLVKILDFWESEARAESVEEAVVQAVTQRLKGYEALTPTGRADSLKGLWKRLGETYPEATQKPQGQPRPQRPQQQQPRPQQPARPPASPPAGETGERVQNEMPKWLEPETKSVPPREKAEAPRPPVQRAPAQGQGGNREAGQGERRVGGRQLQARSGCHSGRIRSLGNSLFWM